MNSNLEEDIEIKIEEEEIEESFEANLALNLKVEDDAEQFESGAYKNFENWNFNFEAEAEENLASVVKVEDEAKLVEKRTDDNLSIDEVELELEIPKNISSNKSGSPEESFECQECGKSFKQKQYLRVHVKIVHNGSKSFECQ